MRKAHQKTTAIPEAMKKERTAPRFNPADRWRIEKAKERRCLTLNELSWRRVMDAIRNPPAPNDKLKKAACRLKGIAE